jgi:hypothetical protein
MRHAKLIALLFAALCVVPVPPIDLPRDLLAADTAEPKLRETDWSKRIAADFRAQGTPAETEFVCPDGSRVDVLTPEFAYEVEWASKWKESIGQAVFYGIATNRQPAVILLMDREQTEYLRCAVVCGKLGVRLETRSVK